MTCNDVSYIMAFILWNVRGGCGIVGLTEPEYAVGGLILLHAGGLTQ
jgi:hypothetical protein